MIPNRVRRPEWTSTQPLSSRGSASPVLVFVLAVIGLVVGLGWYRAAQQRIAVEQTLSETSDRLAESQATVQTLRGENTASKERLSEADQQARQLAERLWSIEWLAFDVTLTNTSEAVHSSHTSTKNVMTRLNLTSEDGSLYEMTNRDPQCDYEEAAPSSRTLRCEFVPRDGRPKLQDVRGLDTVAALVFANPAALTAAGLPFEISSARLCVRVSINGLRLDLGCADSEPRMEGSQFNTRPLFAGFSTRYFEALRRPE